MIAVNFMHKFTPSPVFRAHQAVIKCVEKMKQFMALENSIKISRQCQITSGSIYLVLGHLGSFSMYCSPDVKRKLNLTLDCQLLTNSKIFRNTSFNAKSSGSAYFQMVKLRIGLILRFVF